MDTLGLVPSAYSELLPPFLVFQTCGLVLIFSVFVNVTKTPDPSVTSATHPCVAWQAVGKL